MTAGRTMTATAGTPAGALARASRVRPNGRRARCRMLALAAALALPAAVLARPATPAEDVLRVQRVEIIDRTGFEQPMPAVAIMVPAGWQAGGEVLWRIDQQCVRAYAPTLQARAPDGSAAIELAPTDGWSAASPGLPQPGGCPQATFQDAQQYLQAWVGQHRPGAEILEYQPRPDKSRVLAQNEWQGGGARSWADSGVVRIRYPEDGRTVYETAATIITVHYTRMSAGVGRTWETMQGQAHGVLAWRSTDAEVPPRSFDLVWSTLRSVPEWQARITQAEQQMAAEREATQREILRIQGQMARENLEHIRRRGEIRRQAMQDVEAMRNETWRSTQATQETMHRNQVRAMREVQGYQDPRTGNIVELPHHYNHAWQLRDGTYVLTDNPGFDPRRALGIPGQQLQPTRD